MTADILNDLRRWFSDLQDGEFVAFDSSFPYEFVAPANDDGVLLYCTKPRTVLSMFKPVIAADVGMMGRPGLPDRRDMTFLRRMIERSPVVFLGDLDPPDLLIYAWMRSQLPDLRYFGIGDRFFQAVGAPPNETLLISHSSSERDAMKAFSSVFDEMKGVVGPTCAAILDRERKIEIEGAYCLLPADWDDELRRKWVGALRACASAPNA
jgi:hypothetical protein